MHITVWEIVNRFLSYMSMFIFLKFGPFTKYYYNLYVFLFLEVAISPDFFIRKDYAHES